MIQIGDVYTTFCQAEGILLQKYRDRNGRCIAILFKNIGVRGRCDSPEPCFGNPNPYNLSKKYGSTPPICTAVRPPFVSPYFPGF